MLRKVGRCARRCLGRNTVLFSCRQSHKWSIHWTLLLFQKTLNFSLTIFTKKYIVCLILFFNYWWFVLYIHLNLGNSFSSHCVGYLHEPCLKLVPYIVSFRAAVTTPRWSANSTVQKLAESENTGFSESQATLLLLAICVLNFVQWRMVMKEHNFSIQEVQSTEWLCVPYVCKFFFFLLIP